MIGIASYNHKIIILFESQFKKKKHPALKVNHPRLQRMSETQSGIPGLTTTTATGLRTSS
jgi:hypothetical protein